MLPGLRFRIREHVTLIALNPDGEEMEAMLSPGDEFTPERVHDQWVEIAPVGLWFKVPRECGELIVLAMNRS